MTTEQYFFPTAIRRDSSRIDGKPYYTIWFDYVNTGQECYSHIYTSCRNFAQWDSIITEIKHSDLFITFEPLIWKDEKKGLIDADSVPVLKTREGKGVITEELKQWRGQQANKPRRRKTVKPQGQFGQLFDIEQ